MSNKKRIKKDDEVVLKNSDGLKSIHKVLHDAMERKSVGFISGTVAEVEVKEEKGGIKKTTVWVNFYKAIGGQQNGQYGISPDLLEIKI